MAQEASTPSTPPLLPKLESAGAAGKLAAAGDGISANPSASGMVSTSSTVALSAALREGRMASSPAAASPTHLPPVKTPKEKKSRPAPLMALAGGNSTPSKHAAEPEARQLVFDAMVRGQAAGQTPSAPSAPAGVGQPRSQQLPSLSPPGSGAFTASSAASEGFEVQGLEELEKVGRLGQGSSGFVEKHRHIHSGRELALKILQAAEIAEPQRKAILLELRTFAKCKSPHIVDFYGAFFHDNSIYIALEYMNAGALSSILAEKKSAANYQVPERLLANITWQVLDGLVYLHNEMHVIHRDIKPSNLLLNTAGIVKITDFGVSGELEDDLEQKNKVTFVGTIHYMSPERVVGQPYEYNSDTWSLGLTLMECSFLRYPYASREEAGKQFSFWELMRRIVEQEPPVLPSDTSHSSDLQDFLKQALQKNPQSRPGAAAMKAHAWLNGLLQSAHLLELAAWIAEGHEQEVVAPSNTGLAMGKSLRHGPNPFQAAAAAPLGGGYVASSSSTTSGAPAESPAPRPPDPRPPDGAPNSFQRSRTSGSAHAGSSSNATEKGSLESSSESQAVRWPPGDQSLDQSLRRGGGNHLPPEGPKMDQSLHGGSHNPFSAFQAGGATQTPEDSGDFLR